MGMKVEIGVMMLFFHSGRKQLYRANCVATFDKFPWSVALHYGKITLSGKTLLSENRLFLAWRLA
jgi:hypothetical protein